MDLDAHSVVYDLGCGDGRVLTTLYAQNNKATYIGIERNPLVYVLARIKTRHISQSISLAHLSVIYGDIFNQDLSRATHVVAYLSPQVLDALLPKFERELHTGAKVYSIDFQFTHKQPKEVVDFGRSATSLGQKLFVYQF
jgi:predicted RNA methylase